MVYGIFFLGRNFVFGVSLYTKTKKLKNPRKLKTKKLPPPKKNLVFPALALGLKGLAVNNVTYNCTAVELSSRFNPHSNWTYFLISGCHFHR